MGASLLLLRMGASLLLLKNGRKSTSIKNGRKSTLLNRGATLPQAHDSEGVTLLPPTIVCSSAVCYT